jgi:hypothetical protein
MVTDELRQKADRVARATERYRRHRTLNPSHWHYRLYAAWLRAKDPYPKPQLNFCHYWRVVLVFALPRLLWSRIVQPRLERLRDTTWFYQVVALSVLLGLVVTMAYALIVFDTFRTVMMWLAITTASVVGIIITINYWWCVLMEEGYGAWVNLRKAPKWWGMPTLIVFTAPALVCVFVIMLCMWCVAGFERLNDSDLPTLIWQKLKVAASTLNAHPANRPLLRPWIVMGTVAGMVWAYLVVWAYNIPVMLYVFILAAVIIAAIFTAAFGLMALERRIIRWEEKEKTAIFNVIGLRTWLWDSSQLEAQRFRSSYGYKFRRGPETPPAQLAKVVELDDARCYIRTFLLSHPLPVSQQGTLSRRLVPRPVPDLAPRTEPARPRRWRAFWSATWALLCLVWAGMVFAKRVGACPTLAVKEADPVPPANNERPVSP